MEEQLNKKNDIDAYLGHLEDLSSRIADNISLGHYKDITKLDIERKFIINKISKEASNLNDRRKSRLKLVWVNNNKMIRQLEDQTLQTKKSLITLKKHLLNIQNHK